MWVSRRQPFSNGRHKTALEHNRHPGFGCGPQQRIVLHVAAADLNDVSVVGHQWQLLNAQRLGWRPASQTRQRQHAKFPILPTPDPETYAAKCAV